jgi:hypothetical protein
MLGLVVGWSESQQDAHFPDAFLQGLVAVLAKSYQIFIITFPGLFVGIVIYVMDMPLLRFGFAMKTSPVVPLQNVVSFNSPFRIFEFFGVSHGRVSYAASAAAAVIRTTIASPKTYPAVSFTILPASESISCRVFLSSPSAAIMWSDWAAARISRCSQVNM